MPWYNFVDPVTFQEKYKHPLLKKNVIMGVVIEYSFRNTIIISVKISPTKNEIYFIKLRKKICLHNETIQPSDGDKLNTENKNDDILWKRYNSREYLNGILTGKTVHIKNIYFDNYNEPVGDVYLNDTLINNKISLKKKVTFDHSNSSIIERFFKIIEKYI